MDRDVKRYLEECVVDVRSRPIEYVITSGGCWECVSHRKRKGYARATRNGKEISVHRYIYELQKGEIPDGYVLLHKCDNPGCINPDHLEAGTQRQNIQDMWNKGRGKIPSRRCEDVDISEGQIP